MVLKYTLDCEDKVQQIPNFCTFHRVSALLPKPAGAHAIGQFKTWGRARLRGSFIGL